MNTAIFKKAALAIACSSALMTSSAFALSGVEGKVTDTKNNVYFQGAQVIIKELKLTSITERDGSFRFTNVPAGEYTLLINYLGADPVVKKITVIDNKIFSQNIMIGNSDEPLENVIVYGQRAGQAGALNRQKNANKLISVVSADSIGQLPDQNAAEALQRLPGMFIQRDQGEGRFVGIRGIDPNLNNVTINGVNVPSPESGVRSVAMDVIPSELIQSLEVSKTVTPDMDASAIGGSIEVKSLSAFDRSGESYSVTLQGSHNELTSESSPKASASYSNIYQLNGGNQLGVATAVSWFERKFGSHNVETDGGWDTFEYEDSVSGDDIELFGAEEIEQRYYLITRERLGVALNFDLQTSVTDKYYLRTLYSQFSDDEFRQRNEYKFEKGEILASTATANSAEFVNAQMDRDSKDRFEEQEIISIVAGGENQLQNWLVEYSLGYSMSSEAEPNRIDADFAGEDLALAYLSSGDYPQLMQSAAAHNLRNFELDEIVLQNNKTEDKELSFRFDLSRDFVWHNNNGVLKFGGKYRAREKFNDVNATVYDGGFDGITARDFETSNVDYELAAFGGFGPGMSQNALRQYVKTTAASLDINELASGIESSGQSYQSNEDINALYAMVTLDINDWQIVTGVRYEATKFDTQGNRVELIVDEVNDSETLDVSAWSVKKDYDHLLPSLNVRYSPNEQVVARFAYTNTIARPTFSDAGAFQLIESEITDDGTERKAEVGNPDLAPYESSNIDLSIEYYPGKIGVLSAGLFYKDIDNYIVLKEVQDNGQWQGFEEVIQHVNGGNAELTGLELAWNKNFNSGLMLGLNGTFVDADDELPNQADTVANVMIGFENNQFSTRLSATYKSESFQFYAGDSAVEEDRHLQLDYSARFYLAENLNVYFNAINLTDEPFYLYHGNSSYNYQYEEYGRSFELGFTFSSL
ncbi:MAG: TonB-dependent receptor [Thalassotalea sp.]